MLLSRVFILLFTDKLKDALVYYIKKNYPKSFTFLLNKAVLESNITDILVS